MLCCVWRLVPPIPTTATHLLPCRGGQFRCGAVGQRLCSAVAPHQRPLHRPRHALDWPEVRRSLGWHVVRLLWMGARALAAGMQLPTAACSLSPFPSCLCPATPPGPSTPCTQSGPASALSHPHPCLPLPLSLLLQPHLSRPGAGPQAGAGGAAELHRRLNRRAQAAAGRGVPAG
jgi:hypothetical protein